jgi:hypothetical protein
VEEAFQLPYNVAQFRIYQRQLRLDEIQALRNEFAPMTAGVPQDFIWETKFDLDYKETKSGIVGVPYQPNAFSIATDSTGVDKFAGGYLKARKTNSDTTGIEYPNTSSLLDLSVGAMSVSLWLRAPNWSSYSQLLGGTRPYDGANGFVFFADFESQGVLDFRSSQNTSRPSPRVNLDSQWHHYVFTRQNRDNWITYGNYIWYKDGVASRYGVDTGNINGSQQSMKIGGGLNWGKCAYFDLAYFRIYDRVLTQTEVNALYNETIIPPKRFPEDYVFHATLNDNLTADDGRQGTVVVDSDEDGVYQTEQEGIECTFIPSNNRVRFEDDGLPLGNTNRTMSIWVRPSKDYNTWNNVVGYGDNQTKKLCILGYRDGFTASASAYNYDLESSTELLDGWNHLLLKWDNDFFSDFACYLNGVRVADNDGAIQIVLDTAHTWLCIGGRPTSSDYFCENAYFADARIYDYAMTDQQITSIYEAGINDTGLGTQCKCSDESVFFTADGIQESYQLNLAYDDGYTYETADTLPSGCSLTSNGVVEFDGTGSGTDEQASIVVTVSKTGHVSNTMNVYITVTAVQQVEFCSNCGWEMTDGYCPNQDCPNSPNYVPPVEYCPECGQELMDGVCQNMDCPSSPYYAPQEELCPECGGVMQGGICENSACPASPNYMPEEPPMEEPPMEEP